MKPAFTLADVTSGKLSHSKRLVLGGIEGVGKSTFASGAPKVIFAVTEDGTDQLDVARLPRIHAWPEMLHAIDLLASEKHDYQTLAIDTLDGLEPMLWRHICQRDGKKNSAGVWDIEGYGYGKGYKAAVSEWRIFLRQLERLRARNVHVLLLAHTQVKTFKNPDGPDYDRYQLQLHELAAATVKQWADAVLFANFEMWVVKNDERDRKGKGVSTGARYLHTERTAAWDAKNRYGLPPQLNLSWDEFEAAVQAGRPDDPKILTEQIERQAVQLTPVEQEKIKAALVRAENDPKKLTQLLNYANNQPVAEQAAAEKEE